jgi:excisionase family DNA binding protein
MTNLLTPKEAAQRLRLSMSTLRGWRKKGHGPPVVRLGPGTYRYSEEDIQQYITAAKTISTPAAKGTHTSEK